MLILLMLKNSIALILLFGSFTLFSKGPKCPEGKRRVLYKLQGHKKRFKFCEDPKNPMVESEKKAYAHQKINDKRYIEKSGWKVFKGCRDLLSLDEIKSHCGIQLPKDELREPPHPNLDKCHHTFGYWPEGSRTIKRSIYFHITEVVNSNQKLDQMKKAFEKQSRFNNPDRDYYRVEEIKNVGSFAYHHNRGQRNQSVHILKGKYSIEVYEDNRMNRQKGQNKLNCSKDVFMDIARNIAGRFVSKK